MKREAIFLVGAMVCGAALAQQYRWTDENGVVRYTDTAPPKNAKNVQKLTLSAPKPAAAPQVSFEMQRLMKEYPVTLYTSPSCKEGCELARESLNKRGVPFKEFQVWDQETNDELKRVAGAAEVPTITVGRSVHRGFEQGAYDSLLDTAGYPKAGLLPPGKQKAPEAPEGYAQQGEPEVAKPVAQPGTPPPAPPRGRYDPSGLTGPAPKPGIYDPSGLVGPPPKPGRYDPEKQLK
jgi:glutaredoxin